MILERAVLHRVHVKSGSPGGFTRERDTLPARTPRTLGGLRRSLWESKAVTSVRGSIVREAD